MSAFENNEENARTIAVALRDHRVVDFYLRAISGGKALHLCLAAPRTIVYPDPPIKVQPHFFGWLEGQLPTTLGYGVSQHEAPKYLDRQGQLTGDERSALGLFISTVFKIYTTLDAGPVRRDATLDDPLVIRLPS